MLLMGGYYLHVGLHGSNSVKRQILNEPAVGYLHLHLHIADTSTILLSISVDSCLVFHGALVLDMNFAFLELDAINPRLSTIRENRRAVNTQKKLKGKVI